MTSLQLPDRVTIVEVGPRDGLQNQSQVVDVATKVELINQLSATGLSRIEAGSFVNPASVPQMAGSDEVFKQIDRKPGVTYAALVPNLKGLERAVDARADEIAVFASASETFSQKNLNCSIAESLTRFEAVLASAQKNTLIENKQGNFRGRGYVSCVVGCPYEG